MILMIQRFLVCVIVLMVFFVSMVVVLEDNWLQFCGLMMNFVIEGEVNLLECWSYIENVEWVVEFLGIGWLSLVVWGDCVFVMMVIFDCVYEELKLGFYVLCG